MTQNDLVNIAKNACKNAYAPATGYTVGADLIEKEVSRHELNLNKDQVASLIKDKLSRFNVKTVDDVYAGVGAGDIKLNQIISYLEERVSKNKAAE